MTAAPKKPLLIPAPLKPFVVTWAIDMEADSPLDAAQRVAAFMQDGFTPDDDAFDVTDTTTGIVTAVDLSHHAPESTQPKGEDAM